MSPLELAEAIENFNVNNCTKGDKYLLLYTLTNLKSRLQEL